MATGKLRSTKRSSGGSYISTVTTVVFVSVCILGVWILTSNSYISPRKSTTRFSDNGSSELRSRKIPTDPPPAFDDNPGHLPEDAIRSDEGVTGHNDPGGKSSETGGNTEIVTGKEAGVDAEKRDEAVKEEKIAGPEVEEMKQKAGEIQVSEESTMTVNQHIENVTMNEDHKTQKTDQESKFDKKTNPGTVNNVNNNINNEEHHITEEEQENRMDKHQEQQEESQKQETGTDQVQQNEQKPNGFQPENKTKPPETATLSPEIDPKVTGDKLMVDGSSSGIPKESTESKKGWKTQADQSDNEKERQHAKSNMTGFPDDHKWELCNVTSGTDYIPCLDNEKAIKELRSRGHFEHRERHCPKEGPMCLVPVPEGYKMPFQWPLSRDKIWFHNVPHKSLASVKGHQNWVKVNGEFLTFPGGGTQFIHGAQHYIDVLQEAVPEIAWGKHTRVVLDVGCGVASFGGYLFDNNVLTMSFAPNDEHEAQIQFALERGIPAVSAVMGTQRLPFPSEVFDLVHCARCRVPWHREGGMLLLELNRVLRPGGYFVWSATPVYQKHEEDVKIWKEMSALTVAMCWELVTIQKDKLNSVGVAIYQKPESNECYEGRKKQEPPMCKPDDDPNAAWYVPLQACMHTISTGDIERGSRWPEEWSARVQTPPYWLNKTQRGIYGKPAPDDFKADYEHWKRVVSKSYMSDLGFNWTNVRNVMDMRAVYGGFAAALKDLNLWVMNVVNINSPDTLPIIYERGLFGIYHDWCESFSTYPRTYDLLHADHLFSKLKERCKIAPVMVEVDRIVRPGGKLIVRDESSTIQEVENLLKSLHWDVHLTFSSNQEGILSAQKSNWRPDTYAAPS